MSRIPQRFKRGSRCFVRWAEEGRYVVGGLVGSSPSQRASQFVVFGSVGSLREPDQPREKQIASGPVFGDLRPHVVFSLKGESHA
jgi:hypothetical protein